MERAEGITGARNEQALLQLMERTGYNIVQENGQRKFGGPPPDWTGQPPCRGCEVFIGKIPRDLFEDELVPVFAKIGKIYELRLMMDFSGNNRGYAFVMFTNKDDAKKAIKQLNNYEIRKGRYLGVCASVDNCRLFVGGIPKNKKREEILQEMAKVTEHVVDVIVYPSLHDKTKNRGFAFVEYENHRAAAMARRKLIPGRIQLWSHQIMVDWAEPEEDVDEDIMKNVKILYVRNLMLHTTEETISKIFNDLTNGAVERVKKLRDFAFVHFKTVEDANDALSQMEGVEIDSAPVEVVRAKPVDKANMKNQPRPFGRGYIQPNAMYDLYGAGQMAPMQPAYMGGGGAAYATANPALVVASLPAAGRGQLMNRGSPRGRGRGAAGSRGAGGTRNYSGSAGGRVGFGYNYGRRPVEPRLYDLVPGMELTPTNPVTLKPEKNSVQVLEELCAKNNWGSPSYQLLSSQRGEMQLFLFKVVIPALAGNYPNGFQPSKLCPSVEEARVFAAENVLVNLGFPIDGDEVSMSTSPNTSASAVVVTSSSHITNGGSPTNAPSSIVSYHAASLVQPQSLNAAIIPTAGGDAQETAAYAQYYPVTSPYSPY